MSDDYRELIRDNILDETAFVKATFSGAQHGQSVRWVKVVLRPVLIKNKRHIQFSYFDGQKDISQNYNSDQLEGKLDELLALPFKNFSVSMTDRDVQVNISRKGKAIIHTHALSDARSTPDLAHDQSKNLILPDDRPDPFLQTIGIMTRDGRVRANMRDKFRQVNEFLKLISANDELQQIGKPPLHVVDFGCGNAHLTFAMYHYLNHMLGLQAHLTGIDVKADLIQKHIETARTLGWENIAFQNVRIIDYESAAPADIVLALHACDTATDDALAQAIRWQSKLIFSVPCCHHHLQQQLKLQGVPSEFQPVMRHGILTERLGDILTDSFRSLILRIMGYRADIVEFISTEHTARNLMIRAVKSTNPGDAGFVQEYIQMKSFWQVTPYLEQLLGDQFIALVYKT